MFGAGGYSGMELLRWLTWHPARVAGASSDQWAGSRVAEEVPAFYDDEGLRFTTHVETLAETKAGQVAFLATPAQTAAELTPTLLERGLRVVDLSGGHRLDAKDYPEWYGFEHPSAEALGEAVYGLTELTPLEELARAKVVANPGCYPTAALLALGPIVKAGLHQTGAPIVVDGKSGATGAGRKLQGPMLFSEVADDVRPYRVGKHQHTPEIERALGRWTSEPVPVTFTPHLVPMRRGLLCSAYVWTRAGVTSEELQDAYRTVYEKTPAVRVRKDAPPETKRTLGQFHAEVWAHYDPRTELVSAFCAIDNLVKGAAGQAVQNLNAMLGLPLHTGLQPPAPNDVR